MTLRSDAESVYAEGQPVNKSDVRALWGNASSLIDGLIDASGAGALVYSTKAAMDADLAHAAGTMAWVLTDTTPANNGIYKKTGASGSGSWVYQSGFSFQPSIDVAVAAAEGDIAGAAAEKITQINSVTPGVVFPNSATSNVPRGATGATISNAGSGGTNGVFALAWSGGNFSANPVGTFTVAGGVVTAINITDPGLYIGGSISAPTPVFTASSGLTGAAASLSTGFRVASGSYYWARSTDGLNLDLYLNAAGTATATSPLIQAPLTAALTSLTQDLITLSEKARVDDLARADLALSRYAPPVGAKRADVWKGIGQSNMDRRALAGGESVILSPVPNVYFPDGGKLASTLSDISANRQAFVAAGSNFDGFTVYSPDATFGSKADGIARAARRPTSIFSNALGARDYTELRRGTGIGTTGIGAATGMCRKWRSDGFEPFVKLMMAHGEAQADSVAAGGGAGSPTSYADYKLILAEWLDHERRDAQWAMRRPLYQAPLYGINITYTGDDNWKAIIAAQTDFWLETNGCYHAGPAYPFAVETDRVHSTGEANILLGEMIQKIDSYVERGEAWKPLHMKPFYRSGVTVTIPCHVPRGNLTLDTTLVTEPTTLGGKYGLEFYYGGVSQTISAVSVSGNNIIMTLASDPGVAGTEEVHHALQTVASGNREVPTNLARGNFRDQDAVYSRHKPSVILYNWMVNQKVSRAA